jgi:Do/DeqQ family serine protease
MRKTWLIFSQAVTVTLAAVFVVATLKPQWLQRHPTEGGSSASSAPAALLDQIAAPTARTGAVKSYSDAVERAWPAVVSITASKAPPRPRAQDPWFEFFFGDRARPRATPQIGLGSGVIVSSQGYLLTNNHVVEGADDISVKLADGREATASLVGADPESDLAVLKIDLPQLPAISFADSDAAKVGDVVLAIGNPFGVGQTVTSGIVSALGRNELGINTFEDFIQTDAAINPGNSGGALVDARGSLLGINTAIYSRSGGSMGIGFAIPSGTARRVLEALIKDGVVTRGWIGAGMINLTPQMVEAFKLPISRGALIEGVFQGGPANLAGIKPGDVVTELAGVAIGSDGDLLRQVAKLQPGVAADITVQRGSQALKLRITPGTRPAVRRGGTQDE